MATMWRVRMLGGLQAESEDVTIARFRTRRVGLLLGYLTYYNDRSHSREELADMLWPDLEPEHSKRNLRQVLFSLRHHLEPPSIPAGAVVDAQQSLVGLNPQYVDSDVADFRRALRAPGGQARAVELYRGELLPGFYEDWVLRERLVLDNEYVAALEACLRDAEAEGRLEDAIRYARLAIAKDDLHEKFHADLIRLYLAADLPSSAVAHYDEWRTIAADQLNATPDPELHRSVEAVRRSEPTRSQVRKVELPAVEPEPDPAPVVRLPIQLTRFFGRTTELDRVVATLAEGGTRLLTLTGPAGTGKTRFSIEAGLALAERHGWNVGFVPLADLSDGAGVPGAILAALRVADDDSDPYETLANHFSGLLVLDNMEHILEVASAHVATILERVPNVCLLVTSRQALKLAGEQELDLGTLPVPSEDVSEALAQLSAVPSVGLFVDRARAALPDFALTAHNARAVSEICRKLDGLPLALEIAAGLVGAFTPSQLLQNLEGRLELLRSRRRDLSSRHRSLRAAIDYSYNLLDENQRSFFVSLSVFRGGFTVDAALDVCPSDVKSRKKSEALRLILDLQERSLLAADEAREGGPARFRLLESYREYAAELLDPEADRALKRRHADYFLRLSAPDSPAPSTEDRENRMAAVRFLFEEGAVNDCVSLLLSFGAFSTMTRDVIAALARSPDFETFEPLDQARILRLWTDANVHHSDFQEALRTIQRACEIAERAGLAEELVLAHRKLALVLAYLGRRQESIAQSKANLLVAESRGDLHGVEISYTNIGVNHWSLGELEEARAAYEGAYAASRALRDGKVYWAVIYNLALVELDLGRLDEGLSKAHEGLRNAQADGEAFGVSMCLSLVSRYHRYKGNLAAALATSHKALVQRRKVGFLYWNLQAIFAHAVVLADMGLYREATILLAASRAFYRVDDREAGPVRERLRAALSEAEFERAWADGLSMSPDEAFRFATSFR